MSTQGYAVEDSRHDRLDPERFELLSAYLDDEVSAEERAAVEGWLANDPLVQRCYESLLGLQTATKRLPVPSVTPVETVLVGALAKIDRRNRQRQVIGGSAIAALLVAAVTALWPNSQHPLWQLANSTTSTEFTVSSRESVIRIPKPVVAPPSVVDQALIVE